MNPAVWLIVVASSGSALLSAQTGSRLPDNLPLYLVDAARTSVADFAQALAEARVPAGFIAFDSDFFEKDFEGEEYERARTLWRRLSLNASQQVPLASAVLAFRSRHSGYDVEERNGVLLVRAHALGVVRALEEKRVDRFQLDGVPLGAAINEAQRIVDPAIPAVSGSTGGIVHDAETPPPNLPELLAQVDPIVHVDITNATLLTGLNEIAKEAPGTVWILSRHRTGEYYTLGYRRPRAGMGRLHDQLR